MGVTLAFPILSMTAITGESLHLEAIYTVGPFGEPHRRRSTPQNPYRMRASTAALGRSPIGTEPEGAAAGGPRTSSQPEPPVLSEVLT